MVVVIPVLGNAKKLKIEPCFAKDQRLTFVVTNMMQCFVSRQICGPVLCLRGFPPPCSHGNTCMCALPTSQPQSKVQELDRKKETALRYESVNQSLKRLHALLFRALRVCVWLLLLVQRSFHLSAIYNSSRVLKWIPYKAV